MRAHLALLLVALSRARGHAAAEGSGDRAWQHVQSFRHLVDERFRDTRRIVDYAGALGVSPTHLNRLCRRVLGHSALGVIERRIALEARRQLVFSTLSIKQIGAELGYEDPAYFSRAMTRLLGEAPAALRARTQQAR
jgi:AraC family transcriptional activator of pobA